MSEEPPIPFDADGIAGTLAHIAAAQGDAASVAALAVSVARLATTDYSGWNSDTEMLTLYLEVPTQIFAQLFRVREDIHQGVPQRGHGPRRQLLSILLQPAMHRSDDEVQRSQGVVGEVEAAVTPHLHLHALQHPEGRQLRVDAVDLGALRAQPRRVEPVCNAQAL